MGLRGRLRGFGRCCAALLVWLLGLVALPAIGPELPTPDGEVIVILPAGLDELPGQRQAELAAHPPQAPPAVLEAAAASSFSQPVAVIVATYVYDGTRVPIQGYVGTSDPVNKWDPTGLAAYFFDGTNNHPVGTNADDSVNYMTNVYLLFLGYSDQGRERFYMPGIGSGYNQVVRGGEAIQGDGTAGVQWYQGATGATMDDRADAMIEELEGQLRAGDNVVDVFGFSRGSATAVRFLHKIQEKVDEGDPLYQDVDVRFVALFDEVPSDMLIAHQLAGRGLDTAGYLGTLTLWSPDTYARNADDEEFVFPEGMRFRHQPFHLVSLDERRKEFAVTDLEGADQVGFRGVHSDVGGGYGGNLFELITRNAVIDRAEGFGLNIFRRDFIEAKARENYADPDQYAQDAATYERYLELWGHRTISPAIYHGLRETFERKGVFPALIDLDPTDNSDPKFNDNEPRHLPSRLTLHPSVMWFLSDPLNEME